MVRIGTITFHGAYNFGSMLQTYALQEYVTRLFKDSNRECSYNVINFRTDFQKSFYSLYHSVRNPKNIIKNMVAFKYRKDLSLKAAKFESFLNDYIKLTDEYNSLTELKEAPVFDYYISGSDQIWNVRAKDFSDAYYLSFAPDDSKKISYATSLGPLMIDWSQYDSSKYSKFIERYGYISVRETKSVDNISHLTDRECHVYVDPTMLLKVDEWRKIQSQANYNNGQYILLYCLEPSKEQLNIAAAISKKLNLPILITKYNNKNDMFNSFVKKYDCGPCDFLSYIDNAALVLSSSFHGTVFSMIYNKPFYVFNGMKDNRISSILVKSGLVERSIEKKEDIKKVNLSQPDFNAVNNIINTEINRSKEYLMKAFEI